MNEPVASRVSRRETMTGGWTGMPPAEPNSAETQAGDHPELRFRFLPRRWPWLLFVLCLGVISDAWALRCGNQLISEQDPALKLKRYCGNPVDIEKHQEKRAVQVYDNRIGGYVTDYETTPYEIWTYNFGPQRFMMRITVRDGLVTDIESAGYGY